jgi:hypothetical protein
MGRQLISTLVVFALLVQTLLIAPSTLAASGSHSTGASTHCAEHTPSGKQDCPCCPDGAATMSGCMNLCAAFADVPTALVIAIDAVTSAEIPFIPAASVTHTRAPPNPPPIF